MLYDFDEKPDKPRNPMNDINTLPPKQEPPIVETQPSTSFAGKWLAILGTILVCCFPIGVISTIISLIELFEALQLVGVSDTKMISERMSFALVDTILGLVTAGLGAILLCISISFFKHRQPWVYRASLTSAIITLILFPLGTTIAIVIFVVLHRNKQEFFDRKEK